MCLLTPLKRNFYFVSPFWELQRRRRFGNGKKSFAKKNFVWQENFTLFAQTEFLRCLVLHWFCYFSEKGSYSHRRHSLLLTQTCTSNKVSSNIPERSFVNGHKSRLHYQKQVSDSSHFENILARNESRIWSASLPHRISLAFKTTSLEAPIHIKDRIFTFLKENNLLESFETKVVWLNWQIFLTVGMR
jgi:hypothetical protein